ncbi:MAG: endo alpha-1,4 polygalactosaminidase [Verrucomicrobiota bacterium]
MSARMTNGQMVVVEPRSLNADRLATLLDHANRTGAKVIGYISIGEIHNSRIAEFTSFFERFQKTNTNLKIRTVNDVFLNRNAQFNSTRVDVLSEAWRAWVMQDIDGIYTRGFHGLMLDTVDTVDACIGKKDWPIPRRVESVQAMVSFVRAIKARDRGKFIVQNRGLNLIGEKVFVGDASGVEIPGLTLAGGHADNPDGVLWENAFAGTDGWSKNKEKQLLEIQRSGKTAVIALGYAQTVREPAPFFQKCAAARFIPAWATSSEVLHRELTTGPAWLNQ